MQNEALNGANLGAWNGLSIARIQGSPHVGICLLVNPVAWVTQRKMLVA